MLTKKQGQLIFLAAGSQGLFNEVGPQFEAMGKASFYLGETGKGTEMKLVVNMVRARSRLIHQCRGPYCCSFSLRLSHLPPHVCVM